MKPSKLPISLLILTLNEELNLRDCLDSVKERVEEIFVVDSPSTDKTLEIAREYTDRIYINPFKNQAEQWNWALDNLPIKSEWILKLDGDERMTPELWQELEEVLGKVSSKVNGFRMKRRFYFLGRWIRYGGYYPTWLIRITRRGKGRSEDREMDEHLVVAEGEVQDLKNDFVHKDYKDIHDWIEKHNRYSTREVKARTATGAQVLVEENILGSQAERRRWLKNNFYSHLPKFLRAMLYFLYRYFLRLGFLDGLPGLVFHSLQGYWHQFVIDAKLYEQELKNKRSK